MRFRSIKTLAVVTILAALVAGACSGDADEPAAAEAEPVEAPDGSGVRVVSPGEAAAIQADPPDDLFVLDVRTPEEFDAGHLEGATMIDFYEPDFADRLSELDRDVPYLLYCRSGNRSGQARQMMIDLGFNDVADIDGGITAWAEAGLPVVAS